MTFLSILLIFHYIKHGSTMYMMGNAAAHMLTAQYHCSLLAKKSPVQNSKLSKSSNKLTYHGWETFCHQRRVMAF